MRIAFLVGQFPSLSETFILNQIVGLIEAGHTVDIYAKSSSDEGIDQPEILRYRLTERVFYFGSPHSRAQQIRMGLNLLAKRPLRLLPALNLPRLGLRACALHPVLLLDPFTQHDRYDILHCHFGNIGQIGALLKKIGVPGKLVVSFHGYDISRLVALHGPHVYHDLFEQADLLAPVSEYWRRRLIQLGANPQRIQVLRMGIDLRKFEYYQRPLKPDGVLRLITVARLVEKKGIACAIRAVDEVCKRHSDWNIQYDIIGDGPLMPELAQLIDELSLQAQVHLLGSRPSKEISQHMLDADVYALPSVTGKNGDQEGIPVSLMEAMATGLPVLSTFHTGIPELVQDGVSGFLVPERDIPALADRLEELALHPERRPAMGKNGREFVATHHDIHRLNQQLQETYQSLHANGSKPARTNPVRDRAAWERPSAPRSNRE